MRVIAGSAKGRRLQSVPGESTRPITDRAKVSLFNIIADWLPNARFLDLFAGTGAVGIEALSRGSALAHFVERDPRALKTVQANLQHTRLADRARVELADSFAFLQRYHDEPFDFIFIAPPQYQGMWLKALEMVDKLLPHLLAPFGSVIVQIHPREEVPVTLTHLEEYDRRKYGSVQLLFYARSEDLAAEEDDDDGEWYEDDEYDSDGYDDNEYDDEEYDGEGYEDDEDDSPRR
jgi:16S rRNA (guanine966-N2)-methyltransferase